jgi:hypothetical protein
MFPSDCSEVPMALTVYPKTATFAPWFHLFFKDSMSRGSPIDEAVCSPQASLLVAEFLDVGLSTLTFNLEPA